MLISVSKSRYIRKNPSPLFSYPYAFSGSANQHQPPLFSYPYACDSIGVRKQWTKMAKMGTKMEDFHTFWSIYLNISIITANNFFGGSTHSWNMNYELHCCKYVFKSYSIGFVQSFLTFCECTALLFSLNDVIWKGKIFHEPKYFCFNRIGLKWKNRKKN